MEINNGHGIDNIVDDEDRLSMLTDDILLSILVRADITTAARTSVLSRRWKDLPWLLPELTIDVKDFLPAPQADPIETKHMDEAMQSLTKAARSFLAIPRTIANLQLKLYLINNYSGDIGPLVSEMINGGTLNAFDLAIVDDKQAHRCTTEELLHQAGVVSSFFSNYSCMTNCLTKLSLYNVCFAQWDIHHLLFDCCKELQHLRLYNCDAGDLVVWQIDAPNSKLSVLEISVCFFGRLDVVCLPKLKRLDWDSWICPYVPISFDVVPSLSELFFLNGATVDQLGFKLSEVLKGTSALHELKLDFQGEKPWIQPEGKQLCSVFNKLKKLSIEGIFVEFDLLWTMVLLEAAPSVEKFDIEIWEHPCAVDVEERRHLFAERTVPSWKAFEFKSSNTWLLKELQIAGFSPVQQQLKFITSIMERASNLQTVVLKDYDFCADCKAMGTLHQHIFPKDKEAQEVVVKQLREMICSPARVIFRK